MIANSKGNGTTSGHAISRRRFMAISAMALGGFALAGCSSGASQSSSAESAASSADAAGSADAPASDAASSAASPSAEALQAAASQASPSGKILVACFSATGNTRAVAQIAAAHLGADYFEIEPAVPYTDEDLGGGDDSARATAEQNDPATRPEIAAIPDFSAYDAVLLGHPIWWGMAPRLMCTLLESADLTGKKVAEFCTSGSSGIEEAAAELEGLAPGVNWIGAMRFAAGAPESEVAGWVDSLSLQ